jgi:hypothetical protein
MALKFFAWQEELLWAGPDLQAVVSPDDGAELFDGLGVVCDFTEHAAGVLVFE